MSHWRITPVEHKGPRGGARWRAFAQRDGEAGQQALCDHDHTDPDAALGCPAATARADELTGLASA